MGWVQQNIVRIVLIGSFATVLGIAGCSGGSSSSGGSSDAELLPDTDNDGIVNDHDFDIDGDGIPNEDDSDVDGDGISNPTDDDNDGDGIPNEGDSTPNTPDTPTDTSPNGGNGGSGEIEVTPPTPGLVCSSAQIIPPHHERLTGETVIVKWKLLPKKCGWDQNVQTGRASAASNAIQGYYPLATYSRPVSPGLLRASLVIPHHCALVGDRKEYPIRYTIKEIQKAVAGKNDWPAYEQTVHHYIGNGKTFCSGNSLPDTPEPEPCTTANIVWPNNDDLAGSTVKISWTLLPQGCALSEDQNIGVKPTVTSQRLGKEETGVEVLVDQKTTTITVPCAQHPDPEWQHQTAYYDFSELREALEDTDTVGRYANTIDHKLECAGSAAESNPDIDGDGTPNTEDIDIDGDGIWNKDDPDIDGDGITNGIDPDADGDGTPDAEDETPGGPQ